MNKTLVIYYSLHGNTKLLASNIAKLLACDLLELKPTTPYPLDVWGNQNYYEEITRNKIECELEPLTVNPHDYDRLIIGTPNWAGTVANPVFSFLNYMDLRGKIVYPFLTHGGLGEQNVLTDLKTYCEPADFKQGLVLSSSQVATVTDKILTEWLQCF